MTDTQKQLEELINKIIIENNDGATDDMQVDLIEDGAQIEAAKEELIQIIKEL